MGLEQQEKKIVMEIKKMAKEGQMNSVKVMAKSLVRNRHAVTKMYGLKSQLQAVSLRMAVRGEIWMGATVYWTLSVPFIGHCPYLLLQL